MSYSLKRFCGYILISVLAYSELVRAGDYDFGQDESRNPRDSSYGNNQNIDNLNYMENPENVQNQMQVVRDVRSNQEDLSLMDTFGPPAADYANPPRVEREPEPFAQPIPEPIPEPIPYPLPEPVAVSQDNFISQNNDLINQDTPELIPEATNRRVRGNGADLSSEQTIIGSLDVMAPTSAPSDQSCIGDGINCVENAGCCSQFCSWTRGFTCYTING